MKVELTRYLKQVIEVEIADTCETEGQVISLAISEASQHFDSDWTTVGPIQYTHEALED